MSVHTDEYNLTIKSNSNYYLIIVWKIIIFSFFNYIFLNEHKQKQLLLVF